MTKHYKYGPSSADRWIYCPGSAGLAGKGSPEAEEGTKAHEIAQAILTGADLPECSDEMLYYVRQYVDYVRTVAHPDDVWYVETTMEMTPFFGGTPDLVLVRETRFGFVIRLFDLKYGEMHVSAYGNEQLLCYLWLILDHIHLSLDDVSLMQMTIIQPRIGNTDTVDVPRKQLESFIGVAGLAFDKIFKNPGKHCRWCPARMQCDILHQKLEEVVGVEPTEEDDSLLYDIYKNRTVLRAVLDEVTEEILRRKELDPSKFPTLQEVPRISNNKWALDESVVLDQLAKQGADQSEVLRLKTPTQVEQLGYSTDGLAQREVTGTTIKEKRL